MYFPDQTFPLERMDAIKTYPNAVNGYFKGLQVCQRETGVTIKGSIPKYGQGNNVIPLTRSALESVMNQLAEETGLNLKTGIVYQLEVGTTLQVKHPPREYMACWGEFGRFKKAIWGSGDTVYLITKARQWIGYDKGKEIKPSALPPVFDGFHALRTELKYQRGIKKIFERVLSPSSLYERETYHGLVKNFKDFYFRIPKVRRPYIAMDGLAPADLKDALACIGIQAVGLDGVASFIAGGQGEGFVRKQYAARMRAMIRDVQGNSRITDTSVLTEEIDDLMRGF